MLALPGGPRKQAVGSEYEKEDLHQADAGQRAEAELDHCLDPEQLAAALIGSEREVGPSGREHDHEEDLFKPTLTKQQRLTAVVAATSSKSAM